MRPPLFHVGQAVVLANSKPNPSVWPASIERVPERGPICHVREVVDRLDNDGVIQSALLLEEIHNPLLIERNYIELAFLSKRFAPAEYLPNEALAKLLSETLEPVTA